MVLQQPTDVLPLSPIRDALIFAFWAFCCLVLGAAAVYLSRVRTSDTVAFALLPLVALAMLYENLAILVSAVASDGTNDWLRLRGSVQSFIIPGFIVSLYELTYQVHKRRSVGFCGITFDQGHRRSRLSGIARFSMWIVAAGILLLQITVNAPYISDPAHAPLTARHTHKGLSLYRTVNAEMDIQDGVDFWPMVVLICAAAYFSGMLHRYGTTRSTDVNGTSLNAWASAGLGTLALLLAWVLTPQTWQLPYAMNGAEVALLAGCVVSVHLVHMNIRTLEEWAEALNRANEELVAAMARKQQVEELTREAEEAWRNRSMLKRRWRQASEHHSDQEQQGNEYEEDQDGREGYDGESDYPESGEDVAQAGEEAEGRTGAPKHASDPNGESEGAAAEAAVSVAVQPDEPDTATGPTSVAH